MCGTEILGLELGQNVLEVRDLAPASISSSVPFFHISYEPDAVSATMHPSSRAADAFGHQLGLAHGVVGGVVDDLHPLGVSSGSAMYFCMRF